MTGKAVAKAQSKGASKGKSDAYVAKAAVVSDENKVKRPTSAYFYYCNERRESMKKECTLSMTDQTKKMSEEWRNLDAKKKKKYDDMAAKDKERYEREKAGGKPKTSGGLKRPLSAYFLF